MYISGESLFRPRLRSATFPRGEGIFCFAEGRASDPPLQYNVLLPSRPNGVMITTRVRNALAGGPAASPLISCGLR